MRHIYPTFFAEVDVDQGQVQPLLGDVLKSDVAGARGADDLEPLLLKQNPGCSEEARVIVNDQAAQRHVSGTIAAVVAARIPARPRFRYLASGSRIGRSYDRWAVPSQRPADGAKADPVTGDWLAPEQAALRRGGARHSRRGPPAAALSVVA